MPSLDSSLSTSPGILDQFTSELCWVLEYSQLYKQSSKKTSQTYKIPFLTRTSSPSCQYYADLWLTMSASQA